MFKVMINDGKTEMPSDNIYYVIGKNGIFIRKKMGLIDCVVPVDKISVLEKVEEYASMDIPAIPAVLSAQTMAFFEWVYEEHSSEAVVLLYFNQSSNEYWLRVPFQDVSAAGVDYKKFASTKGFDLVGTIHSHANFGAFHSGIDDADERSFDGLHITIGHNKSYWKSLAVSIVINGTRYKCEPNDYMEDLIEGKSEEEVKPSTTRRAMGRGGFLYGVYDYFWGGGMVADEDDYFTYYNTDDDDDKKEEDKEEEKTEKKVVTITKKLGYNVNVDNTERKFPEIWKKFVKKGVIRTFTKHYGVAGKPVTVIHQPDRKPTASDHCFSSAVKGAVTGGAYDPNNSKGSQPKEVHNAHPHVADLSDVEFDTEFSDLDTELSFIPCGNCDNRVFLEDVLLGYFYDNNFVEGLIDLTTEVEEEDED